MLEMHLAGFTNKEVAEHMGVTPTNVSNVVNSRLGQEFLADRLVAMDREFTGLYRKVISTLSDGLDEKRDISIRLVAADKWLKASGKYSQKDHSVAPVTAEDIVQKLLLKGQSQPTTAIQVNGGTVVINPPAPERPVAPRPSSADLHGVSPEFSFLDEGECE